MSELKAYRPRELVMQGRHNELIYLKSEADKVIADLEESQGSRPYAKFTLKRLNQWELDYSKTTRKFATKSISGTLILPSGVHANPNISTNTQGIRTISQTSKSTSERETTMPIDATSYCSLPKNSRRRSDVRVLRKPGCYRARQKSFGKER